MANSTMRVKCSQRFELSMAYNVRATPTVRSCLKKALAYLVDVFCSPQAAARLADSYDLAILALEKNPTFCPTDYYASKLFHRPIYKKQVGNYLLYFFVEDNDVVAFSFLHKRQNKYTHLRADYDET